MRNQHGNALHCFCYVLCVFDICYMHVRNILYTCSSAACISASVPNPCIVCCWNAGPGTCCLRWRQKIKYSCQEVLLIVKNTMLAFHAHGLGSFLRARCISWPHSHNFSHDDAAVVLVVGVKNDAAQKQEIAPPQERGIVPVQKQPIVLVYPYKWDIRLVQDQDMFFVRKPGIVGQNQDIAGGYMMYYTRMPGYEGAMGLGLLLMRRGMDKTGTPGWGGEVLEV